MTKLFRHANQLGNLNVLLASFPAIKMSSLGYGGCLVLVSPRRP